MTKDKWFGEDLHIPPTYRIRIEYRMINTNAPTFRATIPLPLRYICLMNDNYINMFQNKAECISKDLMQYVYWYLGTHLNVKMESVVPFSLKIEFIDKDKYNG